MSYTSEDRDRAYLLWLREGNIQKVAEITGISRSTLARWKEEDKWDAKADEDVAEITSTALLALRAHTLRAAQTLISIVESGSTSTRDKIAAIKLLFAIAGVRSPAQEESGGNVQVQVDRALIAEFSSLPTAELLKMASNALEQNIVDATNQRVSKKQLLPKVKPYTK